MIFLCGLLLDLAGGTPVLEPLDNPTVHGVHLTALSDAPVVTPTHLVFVEDSRGTRRVTAYPLGDLQFPG